mgnify:CR=1 FL=1
MMKLHLYGDGPRDEITLKPLLERLLSVDVDPKFQAWARLNKATGYDRKVLYAIISAQNEKAHGLVAVCDADKDPKRLAALRAGRESHRSKSPPFPTALGQADPHGEAWLLDDPKAVREALGLERGVEIANVRKCHPKAELGRLIQEAGRDPSEALAAISEHVDPKRCNHASETGLSAFLEDVREELGPQARAIST